MCSKPLPAHGSRLLPACCLRHPTRRRCRAELKPSSINAVFYAFNFSPKHFFHVQRVSLRLQSQYSHFPLLTVRSRPNKVTSDVWHCLLLCEVAAGGIPHKNLQLGTSGAAQTGHVLRRKHGPRGHSQLVAHLTGVFSEAFFFLMQQFD